MYLGEFIQDDHEHLALQVSQQEVCCMYVHKSVVKPGTYWPQASTSLVFKNCSVTVHVYVFVCVCPEAINN